MMSCGCGQVHGVVPDCLTVALVSGADFVWSEQLFYPSGHALAGQPQPFPPGSLYYEFSTSPLKTVWPFTISGSVASMKVESVEVDKIPARVGVKLRWLPAGELAGAQVWASGKVRVSE